MFIIVARLHVGYLLASCGCRCFVTWSRLWWARQS